MSSKLERFTQQARTALQFARDEADRLRHNYIGSEHLLVGLVREPNGIAGKVLRSVGSEADRIAAMVENMTGAGEIAEAERLDLTPQAKQVIEYAVDEARKLHHSYINTEHLLLALLQHEGVAMDVLRQLGLTSEQLRDDVLQAIANGMPDDSISGLSTHSSTPYFPKKPIKLGLTDEAKESVDDVLALFDTGDSTTITKLGEYARMLLAQYNEQQDKPE